MTADPVPYLDILGMAEGFILLICASIPILAPLFRIAQDRFEKARVQKRSSGRQHEDSGKLSNYNRGKTWENSMVHGFAPGMSSTETDDGVGDSGVAPPWVHNSPKQSKNSRDEFETLP